MLEIVLASSNPGKLVEVADLLGDFPISLIPQREFNISDADEVGTTFVENAIIKARHAAKHSGLPALADDSGLTVDALGDAPGVRSARYAGEQATDLDRINKLLNELKKLGDVDRSACFHCVLALIESEQDPAPLICHGIWQGEILQAPQGDKGFGYDPIFYVPTHRCSAAEMDPAIKNAISHRGQAMEQLKTVLRNAGIAMQNES